MFPPRMLDGRENMGRRLGSSRLSTLMRATFSGVNPPDILSQNAGTPRGHSCGSRVMWLLGYGVAPLRFRELSAGVVQRTPILSRTPITISIPTSTPTHIPDCCCDLPTERFGQGRPYSNSEDHPNFATTPAAAARPNRF